MSARAAVAAPLIRLAEPVLGPDVEALVLQVLRSGRLAQGPMVARFEALCAAMAGTEHAIAVSNGTAALEAALEAHGIGPGDEVLTSPFTFAATVNAIVRRGARVRFADIGDDFTIDPLSVSQRLSPRTRAVIPVHLYGLMADLEAVQAVVPAGMAIIEDAAQAHGATLRGGRAGSFGTGTFSFYATKNVTAGEGGVITTDNATLADRLRVLRNQGMRAPYDYSIVGQNLRLTEVAASIAIPQLERLDSIIAARNRNARTLSDLLGSTEGVTLPQVPAGRTHVWHQYTVLLAPALERDSVVSTMAADGVQAGVYYPRPLNDEPMYSRHPLVAADATPRARDTAARCISLPVHPALSETDLERVADSLRAAIS